MPVIVRTVLTAGAVLATLSVNTVELLALYGTNKAVTPVGKPMTAKVTLPVNPFTSVTVIVLVPLPPCVIVRLLGESDKVKLGVDEPAKRLIRPVVFGLPHPVHRS